MRDASENPTPTPQRTDPEPNLSGELQRLRQLHETGALSDEEFARAKDAVLAGPRGKEKGPPGKAKRFPWAAATSACVVLALAAGAYYLLLPDDQATLDSLNEQALTTTLQNMKRDPMGVPPREVREASYRLLVKKESIFKRHPDWPEVGPNPSDRIRSLLDQIAIANGEPHPGQLTSITATYFDPKARGNAHEYKAYYLDGGLERHQKAREAEEAWSSRKEAQRALQELEEKRRKEEEAKQRRVRLTDTFLDRMQFRGTPREAPIRAKLEKLTDQDLNTAYHTADCLANFGLQFLKEHDGTGLRQEAITFYREHPELFPTVPKP